MDIDIRKDVLLRALERCAYPSGKDDTKPFAGYVMMTTDSAENTVSMYAVDTYLSVDLVVPCDDVTEDGKVAVNTKRLQLFVNNIPGDVLHLKATPGKLTVSGQYQRRMTAPLIDPDLFPNLQEPSEDAPGITLEGPVLAQLIRRAQHATDTERAHCEGIKLVLNKSPDVPTSDLELVAINTHKTVVLTKSVNAEGRVPFDTFLPSRFLKSLLDVCDKEKHVSLIHAPPYVYLETEDSLIGAMLPRMDFPDFRSMLQYVQPLNSVCDLGTTQLHAALKAIDAIRTNKSSCVRFKVEAMTMRLDLFRDTTDAVDSVSIRRADQSAPNFEFFADPKFVLDHLKGADGDCELMSCSHGPVVFKTEDYLGFLSPIDKSIAQTAPDHEESGGTKKKTAKKKEDTGSDKSKKSGPGPGRGRKKKPKKAAPPPPPAEAEEENEDELGSADPAQYLDEPPPEGPPIDELDKQNVF